MRSGRAYSKRIEIWQSETIRTSSGGSRIQNYKLAESWAKITTNTTDKNGALSSVGIDDPTNSIKVQVRKRDDLTYNAQNQFIVYANVQYKIVTEPTDIDFKHGNMEFMAVRVKSTSNPQVEPLEFYQANVEQRVIYDGGTVENEQCLTNDINKEEENGI